MFCFVFAALITAQAKIKWTCVLKEINCVLLGLLCVVFVGNGKGSEVVGLHAQVEIEVSHWIQ